MFISVGIAIVSVLTHKYGPADGTDTGSMILIFFNVLFMPFVFMWILFPYWAGFPRSISKKLKDDGCPDPIPWPLGAKKSTWIVAITLAFFSWGYLLYTGLEAAGGLDAVKKFLFT